MLIYSDHLIASQWKFHDELAPVYALALENHGSKPLAQFSVYKVSYVDSFWWILILTCPNFFFFILQVQCILVLKMLNWSLNVFLSRNPQTDDCIVHL